MIEYVQTKNISNLFTDKLIGDEGIKTLSDGMKVNTTLTTLNLKSEEEKKGKEKYSRHSSKCKRL